MTRDRFVQLGKDFGLPDGVPESLWELEETRDLNKRFKGDQTIEMALAVTSIAYNSGTMPELKAVLEMMSLKIAAKESAAKN